MARATWELIDALRVTAARLAAGGDYEWGHMGACNCGHLAQTVTHLSRREIHGAALEREGDWAQQADDYCPSSGLRIDDILDAMLAIGMTRADVRHLEKLSDPAVLVRLPEGRRTPQRNVRDDVVRYMTAWADLLEASAPVCAGRTVVAA